MLDWFFHSTWATFGTAGLIVIICGVVAYIFPPFRRLAIEIGTVVLAATAIYAKGTRDEGRKWNDAIDRDIEKGKQARTDAKRDVASGRVRGSEWDRSEGGL